ncbi:MAG: radical SAM protein [Oscillospiraceae bacterium]|nr:radical SAM protein [Oscillospiraceae bacterium]
MAISFEELTEKHPCFARNRNMNSGRIHLPISPSCNIECTFCERSINTDENRPGVASTVIKPDEAIGAIEKALEVCPDIRVAGIAGPGDTLASPYALDTFRLIKERFPQLVKCMSTNGLLLAERADEIIDVGIDSLTVTVNAVDPEIEAKLNKGIVWHKRYYKGTEAAKILIEQQLKGIELVSKGGITVKVNTVLVPDINTEHIEEIAKTVAERGAKLYNIIPLIPQHLLKDSREPTCLEIERAFFKASKYINVFRHCQRCRADAVGIPGGKDHSSEVYLSLERISHKDTFSHG